MSNGNPYFPNFSSSGECGYLDTLGDGSLAKLWVA